MIELKFILINGKYSVTEQMDKEDLEFYSTSAIRDFVENFRKWEIIRYT
jgi:hypothetical protein